MHLYSCKFQSVIHRKIRTACPRGVKPKILSQDRQIDLSSVGGYSGIANYILHAVTYIYNLQILTDKAQPRVL